MAAEANERHFEILEAPMAMLAENMGCSHACNVKEMGHSNSVTHRQQFKSKVSCSSSNLRVDNREPQSDIQEDPLQPVSTISTAGAMLGTGRPCRRKIPTPPC